MVDILLCKLLENKVMLIVVCNKLKGGGNELKLVLKYNFIYGVIGKIILIMLCDYLEVRYSKMIFVYILLSKLFKNKVILIVLCSKLKGGGSELKLLLKYNLIYGVIGKIILVMLCDYLKVRYNKKIFVLW